MDNHDFIKYYQRPVAMMAGKEPESPFGLFPQEALLWDSFERKEAMNALVRLVKSGLITAQGCWPYDTDEEALKALSISGQNNDTKIDWMAQVFDATQKLIDFEQSFKLLTRIDYPLNSSFKEKIENIFSDAGVGFEKGDVWPEKN